MERENNQEEWSEPINLGKPINSPLNEYYVSFAKNNTIYFASKDKSEGAPDYAFEIYNSEFKNGRFLAP